MISESRQALSSPPEPAPNLLISALYSSSGFFQHHGGHAAFQRSDAERQSLKTFFLFQSWNWGPGTSCVWLVPTFEPTYTANRETAGTRLALGLDAKPQWPCCLDTAIQSS